MSYEHVQEPVFKIAPDKWTQEHAERARAMLDAVQDGQAVCVTVIDTKALTISQITVADIEGLLHMASAMLTAATHAPGHDPLVHALQALVQRAAEECTAQRIGEDVVTGEETAQESADLDGITDLGGMTDLDAVGTKTKH